jgi:hypothetical protein
LAKFDIDQAEAYGLRLVLRSDSVGGTSGTSDALIEAVHRF